MKLASNNTSDTRHAVAHTEAEDGGYGNYKAECGRWVYGEADESPMLDAFPEDFGNLDIDCQDCAEVLNA